MKSSSTGREKKGKFQIEDFFRCCALPTSKWHYWVWNVSSFFPPYLNGKPFFSLCRMNEDEAIPILYNLNSSEINTIAQEMLGRRGGGREIVPSRHWASDGVSACRAIEREQREWHNERAAPMPLLFGRQRSPPPVLNTRRTIFLPITRTQ
jgi:hypothetical protein